MFRSTAIFLRFAIICSSIASSARDELIATADCVCPGQTFVYECSVFGGQFTAWKGSLIEQGCDITLVHRHYADVGGSTAECNNGDVVGQSISVDNDCYRSSLSIEVSSGINGSTIQCNIDDGLTVRPINTSTILITNSAPRPENVCVTVNAVELNFTWPSLDYLCPFLSLRPNTSENCGTCVTIDNSTMVSCSGFSASVIPKVCAFSVHYIVCGNITGEARTQAITLQVPDAPIVRTVPQYLSGRTRSLTELITTFERGDPISISDDIDGSATNFTITYSDSTFGSVCGMTIISASSCLNRTCRHTFNILGSSSCPATTSIVTTVYANSVLGRGPSSNSVTRDGINNLVDVSFSRDDQSIICSFLNQPTDTLKNCSANITYGEDCDTLLDVYSATGAGNTVATPPLETRADVTDYCYVVTATSSNVTVMVEGILTDIGSSSLNVAAIAAPVTIVIVVLVVLITIVSLIAVLAMFRQDHEKSEYIVKFSGENEAGVLARALKVFKDLNINVEVNTHLHHPEFDRKAEKGYNYNYINCIVSSDEIDFLRDELKAEILGGLEPNGNGDEQVYNITAVIRVKDRPGGLWEVLDKIGRRDINLTGVNTGEKCGTSTGYSEIHVKCSCSSTTVWKLRDCLTAIGMANVEIGLYTPKCESERAIEYLVKDQVGALADTLDIFTNLGLNISGVNVDHLRGADRSTKNLRLNYIECSNSVDDQMLETLQTTLKQQYGAIAVETENKILDKGTTDQRILKITIMNETGSLNRALKAFSVLNINLCGVNVLDPVYPRERQIEFSHYHLEIVATTKQFAQLKDALHLKGLATDVNVFDISNYCDITKLPRQDQLVFAHAARQQIRENDSTPKTMMIEFFIRNMVGALAEALQLFGELGITISKVNPAHMASHHQIEYIECFCEKNKRDPLLTKIQSCGASNAEFLPESEVPPGVDAGVPDYCVLKFSVGSNKLVEVLKAFSKVGAEVAKVNPTHIKLLNQYVECCCAEDIQEELLSTLKSVRGVIHVKLLSPSEEHTSEPLPDNYCVIEFSVREEAGILVEALKAFFALNINIIGVNTLKPAFNEGRLACTSTTMLFLLVLISRKKS